MGIDLIPMPFFVDGETYLEGKDCTPETFFQRMKAGAEISTSQPAPEEITSLWDTLLKTHDAVLHFPMSSGLSGSCHTAKALAQEYGGRVLVVDDRRISVTLAQSIRNAQVLLAQGKTAAEVRDILEAERDASSVGMLQAKKTLLEALRHDLATRFSGMKMAVFSGYSGGDPTLGETWRREVQAAFPDYAVGMISLPLSICCHTGEGAVGVACAKLW